MSLPTKQNLDIYQGDTFKLLLVYADENGTPISLAGYTAKAHFRDDSCSTGDPLVEITSPTEIVLEPGGTGEVEINLTSAQTRLLTRQGVWDLEFTHDGGLITTAWAGTVNSPRDITRD